MADKPVYAPPASLARSPAPPPEKRDVSPLPPAPPTYYVDRILDAHRYDDTYHLQLGTTYRADIEQPLEAYPTAALRLTRAAAADTISAARQLFGLTRESDLNDDDIFDTLSDDGDARQARESAFRRARPMHVHPIFVDKLVRATMSEQLYYVQFGTTFFTEDEEMIILSAAHLRVTRDAMRRLIAALEHSF